MEESNITRIIKQFFHKRHSQSILKRFGYWFLMDDNKEEKENIMRKVWEESPSIITPQTWEDLSRLQESIMPEKPSIRLRLWHSPWSKFAAAILLVFVTSFATYHFLPSTATIEETELVEVFVPYGAAQEVALADGSSIFLNAGSLLVYPKKFTTKTRTVFLSGEAHFRVAKQAEQPFIVKTKYMDVEVLGTVFNIRSYPNASYTTATLEEGSVRVYITSESSLSRVLTPNEQLCYSHDTKEVSVSTVNARKLASWKEGYLIFQNASFEEIILALERKYNVQINYNTKKYNGQSYYVSFNSEESLADALSVLKQLVTGLDYKIDKSTVFIK